MNIEAICLDMDGTILDAQNKVSDETINLLTTLRNKGMKIFIATGRTRLEVADVLPKGFEYDGLVTANGMGCIARGRKIAQHALPSELVMEVVELAQKSNIYYEVHPLEEKRYALVTDKEYMTFEVMGEKPMTLHDNEYNARVNAVRDHIRWVEHIHADDIVKIYFFSMCQRKIDDWKKTLENLQKRHDFNISTSSIHNCEISVKGVSKATGIELLLEEFNISRNHILAVGDAGNDIPMFELAGHSCAMKNAEDDVKKFADEVTKYSYNENGLYHYLKNKFASIL